MAVLQLYGGGGENTKNLGEQGQIKQWSKFYGRQITKDVNKEICNNLSRFFKILLDWNGGGEMEENFDLAVAASASCYNSDTELYYEIIKKDSKFINLQLRQWTEALSRFRLMEEEKGFNIEEVILTIQSLCSSLETLAGVNIKPTKNVPSLIALFKDALKIDRGWDLASEQSKLFATLAEIDNINKNIVKHLSRDASRQELLKTINFDKLREYMDATQAIWMWILDKIFRENIPKEQLVFFNKKF